MADNVAHAKELVNSYCWMNSGKVDSNLMDEDTDWKFDKCPDKVIGRAVRVKTG